MSTKVIVGMSGGVDSSVAAYLLQQQGYEVEGLFMKNWEEDDDEQYCAAAVDLADAEQVCNQLNIPLHTVNFSAEYWDRVFKHFLNEYKAGRTPNPDIMCNKEIKFRAFLDYALNLNAELIATGHYVNNLTENASTYLLKAKDEAKDQSYFLHMLTQDQLSKSVFPLGNITKSEVRKVAKQHAFKVHDKKDSTGICFIGERKFKDFLQSFIPSKQGNIRTLENKVIGRHEGVMYYTIGQRQGLGIGGQVGKNEEPWYVVEKNIENNELIVTQGHDHPALLKSKIISQPIHWISGKIPEDLNNLKAKIRYRQQEQTCELKCLENYCEISFATPQWAVAPGQSIVFYQNNRCLGGAIIEQGVN